MEDKNMDIEMKRPHCPVIDVDGIIANGKQFDLDITLPEDARDVIYGTIKNVFKEPIKDAVVKLIEIDFGKDGRKKRIPVSHTFTDKYGEFVFGPLCPGKQYAIDIWVNDVRHFNMEVKGHHEGKCLKGMPGIKCEPKEKFECGNERSSEE
jgi:hypothetical protein